MPAAEQPPITLQANLGNTNATATVTRQVADNPEDEEDGIMELMQRSKSESLADRMRHRIYRGLRSWHHAMKTRPVDVVMLGNASKDPLAIRAAVRHLSVHEIRDRVALTESWSSQAQFFENYALLQLAEWINERVDTAEASSLGSRTLLTTAIGELVSLEVTDVRRKPASQNYWSRNLRAGRRWKTLVDQHGLGSLFIRTSDLNFGRSVSLLEMRLTS